MTSIHSLPQRLLLLTGLFAFSSPIHADILRWNANGRNFETIAGTEGMTLAPGIDLSGWNSEARNLLGAMLGSTDLSGANFSQSWLDGVSFRGSTLTGANLSSASLRRGNLSGTDLTAANLAGADLTEVWFRERTKLTGADLAGAIVTGANFYTTEAGGGGLGGLSHVPLYAIEGFTAEQLYSTLSYQENDLVGTSFFGDLSGWNFREQDLTGASFKGGNFTRTDWTNANLTNAELFGQLSEANLAGANLKNARLYFGEEPVVAAQTVYNQWTQFPDGFDPVAAGMTFEASPVGDFDANDLLDREDYAILEGQINRGGWIDFGWLEMLDLDRDEDVNHADLSFWLTEVKRALPGDADLDGKVAFSDFLILSDGFGKTGDWTSGDFDFNGEVLFADFLLLAENFGNSADASAISVPEPTAGSISLIALLVLTVLGRVGMRHRCHFINVETR